MSTLTKCERCGDMVADECETCADLVECVECGCDVDVDDAHVVDYPARWADYRETAGPHCDECAAYCEGCGEYHHADNFRYWSGVGERCHSCSENLTECAHCGETLNTDYDACHYDDWSGDAVCSDCYEPEGGENDEPVRPTVECPTCGTANHHFHVLTESYVCDHVARDLGEFVTLAHPLPAPVAA